MIRTLEIKPIGVPLHKFNAEVDVVAENVCNGNLLIKMWNNIYKELTFSDEEECWLVDEEFRNYPTEDCWKRLVKGHEHETVICTTIPC